ncbi:MAG TPA: hypothetical protein VJR27_05195 [Candidatus Saccharimonadales bacterium]|nr:hypothetical protein [Candidatus Saccharimonadales bacterium]
MIYKNRKYGPAAPKKSKRKWWVAATAIVIVLLLGAAGAYWKLAHTHKKTAVSASSDTKGEASSSVAKPNTSGTSGSSSSNTSGSTSGSGGTSSTSSNGKQEQTQPASGTALQQPQGNFVSSHVNVPANATEQSVCTTTPGATCVITFTSNGTTKSLPSQATDRGGSAYWTWTPQSIGLTTGIWTVTASATLNGQTQSTTDATPLKVE